MKPRQKGGNPKKAKTITEFGQGQQWHGEDLTKKGSLVPPAVTLVLFFLGESQPGVRA